MISHYFISAFRNLWKNRFYSILNISGLSVGLAAGILLLLWVRDEQSFDKFNIDYQHIFSLSSHFKSEGEERTWAVVPGSIAVYARSMTQVSAVVRIQSNFDQVLSDNEKKRIFDGNMVAAIDTGFFSMFTIHLLEGNRNVLFPNTNAIVITRSTARKLFGKDNATGKIVMYHKEYFTVTGVMQDFPENSSLKFDAVLPMAYYAKEFTQSGGNGDWKTIDEDMGSFAFNTFVKLTNNADPVETGHLISSAYNKARNGETDVSFQLQNLGDMHLVGADGNMSKLRMVQIFILVIFLLLAIASINYVNLSTARSLIRAKEVCIRKISGANKQQLFLQFTVETLVLFCFATILSVALILLLIPLYNDISGKTMTFNIFDLNVWKVAGMVILGTLAASSIYPALLLSSFKPVEALKGKISTGIGITAFRKGLVVLQFVISVILIVSALVMSHQLQFIKQKDLGFDKSCVFSVPLPQEVVNHMEAVKDELHKNPAILNVALSDAYNFLNITNATSDLEWSGKSPNSNFIISQLSADKDFIPAMHIKFIEGENFTGTPADAGYFILNKTAVMKMGLRPPYSGQPISFHDRKGTIRGVVQDFNFQSLRQQIAPIILFTFWNNKNILYIRTSAGNAQQAIASVEKQYKKYVGHSPFHYTFLDTNFDLLYRADQRTGILFNVFAGIAIFISCLGLFGLSTYSAQAKTKEIGIRKVLGSSVGSILLLICKNFLKLVIIAILIASPLAWWAMDKWLQGFVYRVNISWWIFVLAGVFALLIAILTVCYQAIKAALANPIKSLRTE